MRLGDLDALKNEVDTWGCNDYDKYDFIEAINNAPTVCGNNPKWCESCVSKGKCASTRPQGEWVIVKDKKYGDNFKCPFCGKELAGTDLNFCCKCGVKLRRKLP